MGVPIAVDLPFSLTSNRELLFKFKVTIMTKIYFFCAVLWCCCGSILAQPTVTVRVDMNAEAVSADGVHIAGSFNGWNTSISPMVETSPGSGIYEFTINADDYGNVNVNDNIEYKILNGNAWGMEENVSSLGCTWTHVTNRVLTILNDPQVLPTFPFAGCPTGGGTTPMTFFVDVTGQDVSNGVYVVGEFIGWNNPGNLQMSQVNNTTVYSVTTNIPTDLKRLNFKYLLGPNYNNPENFSGGSCINGNDRFYNVTGSGTEATEVYFFSSCDVSAALPIELSSFTATTKGGKVELNWSTAMEEGVDYFRIERSVNRRDFAQLAEVRASNNRAGGATYQIEDAQPANGINYYRLVTVDLDGTEHYEGIRAATVRAFLAATPIVFPNPVGDQFNVAFQGEAKVVINDAFGRLVHQSNGMDGYSWTGIATLKSGYYYLQLETATGIVQTTFLKQ